MSKKKIKLEVGKFYQAYGGNTHPAKIYEKTSHGTYKSIKFGTSKGRHMIKIRPIQKGYDESYVHTRPFEGARSDYGNKELLGLSINPSDNDLIERIKKNPSNKTTRARERYKK